MSTGLGTGRTGALAEHVRQAFVVGSDQGQLGQSAPGLFLWSAAGRGFEEIVHPSHQLRIGGGIRHPGAEAVPAHPPGELGRLGVTRIQGQDGGALVLGLLEALVIETAPTPGQAVP